MSQHLPLVEQFLTYLTDERHFSPYTSRCYGLDLRQFIEFMTGEFGLDENPATEQAALDAGPESADEFMNTATGRLMASDPETIRAFLVRMSEQNYSAATMARKIATLRSFHKWAERRGLVRSNPMVLIRTPKQAKRLPKAISVDEIERLLSAPDPNDLLVPAIGRFSRRSTRRASVSARSSASTVAISTRPARRSSFGARDAASVWFRSDRTPSPPCDTTSPCSTRTSPAPERWRRRTPRCS